MSMGGGGAESRDNETTRIETFSDGVFAITLLVLEIRVPEVGEGESLLKALVELWPSYLGYGISFLVLGAVWANHHNRFRYIARSDHMLLFINLVFYIAAFALAFLSVTASLALIVGLALLVILPEPGSRPGKPEASAEDDRATTEKPDGA